MFYEVRVKYGLFWQAKFLSKIIVPITGSRPVAIDAHIFGNNHDHFIQFWLNLNAACESSDGWVAFFAFLHTELLSRRYFIQFAVEWIWDVNGTLSTVYSCTVPVNWILIRSHLILSISTFAVCPDARDTISLHHLEQAFTFEGGYSSWYTIRRDDVNPDQLVCHFDASTFYSWSQCSPSKPLCHA